MSGYDLCLVTPFNVMILICVFQAKLSPPLDRLIFHPHVSLAK